MKQKKLELTPEEENLILEKRKKEESNKARKIGFLKEDIYEYDPPLGKFGLWSFLSESGKNTEIKIFKSCFRKTLSAGSEFSCYVENGKDCWYDNNGCGYECLDSHWAKENLINIQDIK